MAMESVSTESLPQAYNYSSAVGYASAETTSEPSSSAPKESEAPSEEPTGKLVDVQV